MTGKSHVVFYMFALTCHHVQLLMHTSAMDADLVAVKRSSSLRLRLEPPLALKRESTLSTELLRSPLEGGLISIK